MIWKSMSKMHIIDHEFCYHYFCCREIPLLWQKPNKKGSTMLGLFVRNANEVPTMMIRRLTNVRFLSQTNRAFEKSSSSSTAPPQPPSPQTPSTEPSTASSSSAQPWSKSSAASHKLTNFDKRILVWSGKYKNVNDIPTNVAWVNVA